MLWALEAGGLGRSRGAAHLPVIEGEGIAPNGQRANHAETTPERPRRALRAVVLKQRQGRAGVL
jgi:hypothetical protein